MKKYAEKRLLKMLMLNEGRIFKLCFNYSYSNLNAGNLIFVCKGVKKVNSR